MTSAGNISGVNCSRENFTWIAEASDFTASVLAKPGTPSSSRWPLASNPTHNRSSKYFCPTMTLFSSANNGCTNALARCTSSVTALIPALIMFLQKKYRRENNRTCAKAHAFSFEVKSLRNENDAEAEICIVEDGMKKQP